MLIIPKPIDLTGLIEPKVGVLKRHSHSYKNNPKLSFGIPLNLRICLFAWFQKFSIPLIWCCLSANSFKWLIRQCLNSYTSSLLYPFQQSEYTMLSGTTLLSMMGINVRLDASEMILVYTRPPRFNNPTAPRPRLSFTLTPKKSNSYQSRSLFWRPLQIL